MEAQYERTVFQKGQASIVYFMIILLATGLAFGVVNLFVIETYVLSRLARLGKSISLIAARGNLSERIALSGNDELSQLAHEINRMLEALQKADQNPQNRENGVDE